MKTLNKITLIGAISTDINYNGEIANFTIVTSRKWTTSSGEEKNETVHHPIVAFGKVAELCNKLLAKSMKVYIDGRVNRNDKVPYEVVVNDMIVLKE